MPDNSSAYNASEIATIQTLGVHYMQYGEYRKARQLLELAYTMGGARDADLLAVLVDAAYREGNIEKFGRYVRAFSKKDIASPRRRILLSLFMYFNQNRRAFELFQSVKGIMRQ